MVLTQQECAVIDSTFGPHAGDCRGGLDFTLLFEETIFCILPLVVLIVASAIRFMFLSKRSIKVISSHLVSSKMVSIFSHPGLAHKTANHRH
jgi:ATP-binding cassette subfamily C (CFTR/MRP) protein 1